MPISSLVKKNARLYMAAILKIQDSPHPMGVADILGFLGMIMSNIVFATKMDFM